MRKTPIKKINTMFDDFGLISKKAREKLVFSPKNIKENLDTPIINSDRATNIEINKETKEKKNGELE